MFFTMLSKVLHQKIWISDVEEVFELVEERPPHSTLEKPISDSTFYYSVSIQELLVPPGLKRK